jgi:hypothetical protein
MHRLWLLAPVPALALGWASSPFNAGSSLRYRCEFGRHIMTLEHERVIRILVQGQHYDLERQHQTLARGHGLQWQVTRNGATLTRVSSGYVLARGCVRR